MPLPYQKLVDRIRPSSPMAHFAESAVEKYHHGFGHHADPSPTQHSSPPTSAPDRPTNQLELPSLPTGTGVTKYFQGSSIIPTATLSPTAPTPPSKFASGTTPSTPATVSSVAAGEHQLSSPITGSQPLGSAVTHSSSYTGVGGPDVRHQPLNASIAPSFVSYSAKPTSSVTPATSITSVSNVDAHHTGLGTTLSGRTPSYVNTSVSPQTSTSVTMPLPPTASTSSWAGGFGSSYAVPGASGSQTSISQIAMPAGSSVTHSTSGAMPISTRPAPIGYSGSSVMQAESADMQAGTILPRTGMTAQTPSFVHSSGAYTGAGLGGSSGITHSNIPTTVVGPVAYSSSTRPDTFAASGAPARILPVQVSRFHESATATNQYDSATAGRMVAPLPMSAAQASATSTPKVFLPTHGTTYTQHEAPPDLQSARSGDVDAPQTVIEAAKQEAKAAKRKPVKKSKQQQKEKKFLGCC